MNFSNACRLKKGLSLILIVLMVVGMFSGCKKNNSETEPNTTPSPQSEYVGHLRSHPGDGSPHHDGTHRV